MGKTILQQEADTTTIDLPDEILEHIFSYLPIKSLARTVVLSKHWNRLCLWRSHPHLIILDSVKTRYSVTNSPNCYARCYLAVPDINQLPPEADAQRPTPEEIIETASRLFNRRENVPPTDDLTAHFQAHDAAMASVNLSSAEIFADLQDDLLISLGTPQAGYVAGDVGEGISLLVGGSGSQQQAEASASRGDTVADDGSDVQVVEPPAINEVEELSNEAFFGYYGFPRDAAATSFLSFVRDRFPYSFFKVHDLYNQTMGRMQLECLYTFLQSIKGIRVCDLGYYQIEEIGLTVQNFDKLGFDIWWAYKELEAAKTMRENEQLWKNCEGAKAALDQARTELVEAQSVVTAAEVVVEERRKAYEHMVEEARLGDRLVDVPLCGTNPFLKKIFG